MPVAFRTSLPDLPSGDTGMTVDPCTQCGHSLLDHWTPGAHPCTVDDCSCERWQEEFGRLGETFAFAFPPEKAAEGGNDARHA